MVVGKSWIKRRWFDFRLGHTVYLAFVLAFGNFVMISYGLYIDNLNIQIEFWQFGILLIGAYFPIAIIIGAWHRKTQVSVETEQLLKQNPMMAKYIRILLDAIDNKLTDEEKKKYRDMLLNIESGKA